MRLALVTLIFAIWFLVGLTKPAYACGLLLWVDIFAPLELAYSTGAYPISLMAMVGMMISFFGHVVMKGFRPAYTYFFWMTALFIAWATICTFLSPFQESSKEGLVRMLKYLVPLMVLSLSTRTLFETRFQIYCLVFALGVWGSQVGIGCIKNGVNTWMIIHGTQVGDNNFFAAAMVSILPCIIYLIWSYKYKLSIVVKLGFVLMLLLCFVTIVFSNSRGAALGMVGNVIIYLLFISKRKIRDITVALTLGVVVALCLPQSFYDRMSTLKEVGTDQAEGSAKERMLLLKSTINAIQDYPLFGVGPYSWVMVSSYYTGLPIAMQPHNIWLKCGVEVGYPGLFLFMVLIFGTVFRLLRMRNQALLAKNLQMANLGLALATSLLGYTISLTFLSNYDLEIHWAWMAIGNAAVEAWNQEQRPGRQVSSSKMKASKPS